MRALVDLDQAVELDPKYVEPYINRGVVYSEIGDTEHAIEDLETALELAPDAPWRADVEAILKDVRSQQ